jgi:uncharacterized FAD-dependent dehydrogenase
MNNDYVKLVGDLAAERASTKRLEEGRERLTQVIRSLLTETSLLKQRVQVLIKHRDEAVAALSREILVSEMRKVKERRGRVEYATEMALPVEEVVAAIGRVPESLQSASGLHDTYRDRRVSGRRIVFEDSMDESPYKGTST